MKRVRRIKFPQRHVKPSSSPSEVQASSPAVEDDMKFVSSIRAPKLGGGKASDQPKRTTVSQDEIVTIMLGGSF